MKLMESTGFLVTALTLGDPLSVHGHQGDRIYPIFEVSAETGIDLKDGVVDDWGELIGESSFTALDFTLFESLQSESVTKTYEAISGFFKGHFIACTERDIE